MADNNNNNNNGNPIVNPNNLGRNNNGLDNSELRQSISINADRIIEAIKENGGNNSRNSSNNREKNEAEKIIDAHIRDIQKLEKLQNKRIRDELKNNDALTKLQRIKDLSRRGSEEERKVANRFLELKKDEIARLEDNIKKQAELEAQQRTLEQKEVKLNEERIKLIERESSTSDTAELAVIEKRLNEIVSELEDTKDEQKTTTDQLNELAADRSSQYIAQELRDTTNLISTVSQNTDNLAENVDSIEAEQRKENKRKAKEEKIKNAKDYKIAENLEDCFSDGLFGLAGNLDKTFKEATNNHINAMKGSIAGNIAGFVEKSFFSIMDYQTTKLTDAIGTLQSSFESTGMNISKAVLADRDEIASSWQNVTDELEERGYGEALNVTELFGLQEQMSKAGITDTSLQERVAVSSGIASALTGMAAPDFMSSEQLQKLNEIFEIEKRQNGEESALNKIDDLLQYFAGGLGNAVEQMGSGFSLAEGKSQELFSNYLDNITRYGIDAAKTTFASTLGTQASMGTWTGGLDIFNQMQQSLNDLYTKGISDNVLTQLSGISTTTKLTELIKSGNYEEAFKSMLTTLSEQGGEVRTEEQSIILDQVFGINADQFNSMLAGAGSLDKLFEDIDKIKEQTLLGTESEVYQQRSEKVKTGRIGNTKEQQDRNLALTDAVDLWATAEKSDIREADKLLISAINATNSGIQSAISFGIEKLINHFTGAGTNAVGSLLSGGAAGAGSSSTAGALGATIGGKAIGLGPTIAAALGSFAAGYGLGTFIDKQTGASEALSDWLVGGVTLSEAAITNLSDIQKENEEENNSYHSTVKELLQKNNDISEATKNAIANKIDDVIDNVSEERNAKQNIGRTFKQQIEDNAISIGGSQFTSDLVKDIESTTGKSFSDVSETELADYYLKNQDKLTYTSMDIDRNKDLAMDMQQTVSEYKGNLATSSYELADTVLSNYASAGYIAASDQGKVYDDLVSLALNMGLKDEERDKLFNAYSNRLTTTNENFYNYQAAKRVQQFIIEEQTKYKEEHQDEQDYNALSSGLEQIAKDIKSGTYEGLSDSLLSDVQKAQDYIDMSKWGLDTIAEGLKITSENYYDKYSPDTVSKFATGLDYVPYDNFPALLHKGERVVTAADARLDDLANSVYLQQIYSSNFNKDNNNIEDLTTTNNSIEQGFNTTADNQSAIIAALQAIINILSNNQTSNMYRDMNNVFNDINTNSIALRANNIAKMASVH